MIREINKSFIEKSGALELVWRVFEEFEAPEYSDEGIQEFKDFISLDTVKERLSIGALFCWGYFIEDNIVGVIATRPPCHIALLFVDKEFHCNGIARKLYKTVLDFHIANSSHNEVTVNSSPYAVEAYRRLGFVDTDIEQTVNGLRFIPMKHKFR